jgi:hypothetical protein
MQRTVTAFVTGFAVLSMSLAGCATSPEPGVTSRMGSVETEIDALPQDVAQASSEVLSEMNLFVIRSEASRLNGNVLARSPQDERVEVSIDNSGEGASTVSVDAGGNFWNRDQGVELTILRRIRERLGQPIPGQQQQGRIPQPQIQQPSESQTQLGQPQQSHLQQPASQQQDQAGQQEGQQGQSGQQQSGQQQFGQQDQQNQQQQRQYEQEYEAETQDTGQQGRESRPGQSSPQGQQSEFEGQSQQEDTFDEQDSDQMER